jgi:hypothetical protein
LFAGLAARLAASLDAIGSLPRWRGDSGRDVTPGSHGEGRSLTRCGGGATVARRMTITQKEQLGHAGCPDQGRTDRCLIHYLNAFMTMLWFFLWILWIFLVVSIIVDIFRSPDLNGWARPAGRSS